MKELSLGEIQSHPFSSHLIITISKEFLHANDEKPLIFEAKLTKEGQLVLRANLTGLRNTKEVDNNAM